MFWHSEAVILQSKIKIVYLYIQKNENMDNIKNLLNLVGKISEKNNEILDATGGRFNIFRVCGVNHYENIHSAIIAEFLNPKGSHGLKSKLLECFIETLCEIKNEKESFKIENFNCENAHVGTEHHTGNGFIDILITDNQNKAIIIENKIYAGDQPDQLKRYDDYAKENYKGGSQIVYLTLGGGEASEQSCEGVDYLPISFAKTIIDWLEKCVAIASRFPMVRETIIQYINHLKQLTNQDMSAKNEKEVVEVLINNIEAAKIISQDFPKIFDAIAKKRFNEEMEKFAESVGLTYEYWGSTESYLEFNLKNPAKWNNAYIRFTKPVYGITTNNEASIFEETQKTLHERMKKAYKGYDAWWGLQIPYPVLTIDTWKTDILNSDNFFKDCKEKVKDLLRAMEGLNL